MNKNLSQLLVSLMLSILVTACATQDATVEIDVPDTNPGDELKSEYLLGVWCADRELTATINREAGLSAMINASPVFWKFKQGGIWQDSPSGWMHLNHGTWKLKESDHIVLDPENGTPTTYQASFKNFGTELYLEETEGFRVLSRCD